MEDNYDVIVVGGGTAGMIASIAAARLGIKILVIEKNNYIGGTAAFGIPFLGMFDGNGKQVNSGLAQELVDRLHELNGTLGHVHGAQWNKKLSKSTYKFSLTPFDPEVLKYAAQEMILEAGGKILLHTYISDIIIENNIVTGIEIVNKSGKQKLYGKIIIDATGDADIASMAGVPMQNKDKKQNVSIIFRVGNVNLEKFLDAIKHENHIKGWEDWHTRIANIQKDKRNNLSFVHAAGHFVPWKDKDKEVTFTAVSIRDKEIYLNATRTTNIDGTNGYDITKAEIMERKNVFELMNGLKENVPGFENSFLASTSPVGIRESRNIIGDYILQKEDVIEGRDFKDGVARGAYPIDIHDPDGGRTQFTFIKDKGSYNIPYRCFLPIDIEGLIVAGRSISATKDAIGTARIMGTVLSQGEAAGTAAALSIKQKVCPRQLDVKLLREKLTQQGAII